MRRLWMFLLSAGIFFSATLGCADTQGVGEGIDGSESAIGEVELIPSCEDEPEYASPVAAEPPVGWEDVPNHDWEFAEPEMFGVDSSYFEEIHRRIAASEMLAVVVVKDGVIVDEFYQEGYDEDSLFWLHSVTKSVMSSLTGIAIEQGILDGVDTRLGDIFPQIAQLGDSLKQEVTIAHLLAHTSGIGHGDTGESFQNLMQAENWVDYYLSQPMTAEPGTTFRYTTAGSHMLSAVLEQAGPVSTYDFAVEHLFDPLGIVHFEWGTDPQGIVDGGNGLHLNVRDAAKFGQLYLDGGKWRDRQIVPQAWVEESTAVHSAGEPDKGEYGYQWWVKSFGADDRYSGFYALGYAGQFLFVVPELKLVTAVASKSTWSSYTAQVCFEEIITAFEG